MHTTKVYLYVLFDKLSGNTLYYQTAVNDSRAILKILEVTRIPLRDSVLLRLGELETNLPPVNPDVDISLDFSKVLKYNFYRSPKEVSWSACKLPESSADSLAPLGLSQSETVELVRRQQEKLNLTR